MLNSLLIESLPKRAFEHILASSKLIARVEYENEERKLEKKLMKNVETR